MQTLKTALSCFLIFVLAVQGMAQGNDMQFKRADTLRGSNGPGRAFWDILHYDITVNPDFETKTLSGSNNIRMKLAATGKLQLDLQEPMQLDSALINTTAVPYTREGNVYWLEIEKVLPSDISFPDTINIRVYFHGKPRVAVRPPWDGGWVWTKDSLQRPWMSVACQGLGASVWYPCKDYQGDKPDAGATLRIVCPDSLVAVGNGRLLSVADTLSKKKVFTWNVVNPINTYCIVPYIGKYVHWDEMYPGLNGPLSLDYWVLEQDLQKAKRQFSQAAQMMKAFEYWFGPYPFYEDGYKLVQSSYLGMEHQSDIAYGNHFKNGYLGRDLSGTGWGLKWDFIIVHESGHEWFGNNITSIDIADMWVHEGFTNYSEALYTEFYYGKRAGEEYIRGIRQNIQNDIPITGKYGVNNEGSGDMYYKASNMIHLIRQLINDDGRFRMMLTEMNRRFRHSVVTATEIEDFMQEFTGLPLQPIFNQYLHTTRIPVLEYRVRKNRIQYRFAETVEGFRLNLPVTLKGRNMKLLVTNKWRSAKMGNTQNLKLGIDPNYLIISKRIND